MLGNSPSHERSAGDNAVLQVERLEAVHVPQHRQVVGKACMSSSTAMARVGLGTFQATKVAPDGELRMLHVLCREGGEESTRNDGVDA